MMRPPPEPTPAERRNERRERIAVQFAAASLSCGILLGADGKPVSFAVFAQDVCNYADAVIWELDRRAAP